MISPETLRALAARITELGVSEHNLSALRQGWPELHFTCCSDDDIPARLSPAWQGEGFALYLVSHAQHCISFTSHPEQASGVVLAACTED